MATEDGALHARLEALEHERQVAFEDAQREADALFAQYQLSQLIASGGSLDELATAVLHELVRLAGASGGALWLGAVAGPGLDRVAVARPSNSGSASAGGASAQPLPDLPRHLESVDDAGRLVAVARGARTLVLSDEPPETLLLLWPAPGGDLDDDGLRVAQLARHELAVAFAGARLHEALERERHELGAIVDGATDLIIRVDAAGRVTRINPAGERLLGLTSADAIGRTCGEVLGCELAGGHAVDACPLAEVRAAGRPIAYHETSVRGATGEPVRVAGSYAATPGPGPAGAASATAILRDIGAVRALEALREGFVATVSHELRTPLALIRGYAETLLHLDLDPAQQRAFVERIEEATSRLTVLVDQVLDVTHLQADPLILDRSTTSFASLAARLRGDLKIAGGAERLHLLVPDDLPAIEVDIARVGQILANLVGNALKYTSQGSPITLGALVEGDWLVVAVDDEGVGIPVEDRALVTEPFHRAWNVRESRIPGTGLGLFICRRLVEAHGGRLWLGDRPDGRPGTRVAFSLPVAAAAPRRTDAGSLQGVADRG